MSHIRQQPLLPCRRGGVVVLCCTLVVTLLLSAVVTISATSGSDNTALLHGNSNVETVENLMMQVRLSLQRTPLNHVPSCQHTYSHVAVTNIHATASMTVQSIQTTPEETLLVRHSPNAQQQNVDASSDDAEEDIFSSSSSSSSSWDQRSIPQQIHLSPLFLDSTQSDRTRSDKGFLLEPGQTAIIPITYLPRYPCTLGSSSASKGDQLLLLEDYYAQQAPYQIAFSSTFDPDDDNFSLAKPPPPKLTKIISGTARADWQQLVNEMPPQERSNWLQQQQQNQQNNYNNGADYAPDYNNFHPPTSTNLIDYNSPTITTSTNDESFAPGASSPSTSSEEWLFQVRTTVLIKTSRGPIQIPVRASSQRQNSFGLPDVIYFDQDEDEKAEEERQRQQQFQLQEQQRLQQVYGGGASGSSSNNECVPCQRRCEPSSSGTCGGAPQNTCGGVAQNTCGGAPFQRNTCGGGVPQNTCGGATPQLSTQQQLPGSQYHPQQPQPHLQPQSSSSSSSSNNNNNNNNNYKHTPGVLWLDTDLATKGTGGKFDTVNEFSNDSDEDDEGNDDLSNTSRDCYNLFLSNPSPDQDMKVSKVFVSRPDLMNLQVHGELRAPSDLIDQWWNSPPADGSGGDTPAQGSLVLGPGEQKYVVTVCKTGAANDNNNNSNSAGPNDPKEDFQTDFQDSTTDEQVAARAALAAWRAARAASAAKYSLGFLHIRTEAGQRFYVALEQFRQQCQMDGANAGSVNKAAPEAAPSSSPLPKQQAYPPSYHHALYKVQDQPTDELSALKANKSSVSMEHPTPLVTSALKSVPSRLDFSLLSSSESTVVSHLGIHNPKDYPVKIMRAGVAVEFEEDSDPDQPNPAQLGLHMSVKIKNSLLDAGAVTEEALTVTCRINWDKFQSFNLQSLFFHGNAILRATSHVDFNYNQWIRNLVTSNSKRQQGKIVITNDYADEPKKTDEYKQTEFVLEIPLTVSMVQGKIGVMIHRTSHPFPHLWAVQSWKEGLGSVSSIFYPQRPFDIRAELDTGEGPLTDPIFGPGGIDHKLRIFANINIPSRVSHPDEDFQPHLLQLASANITEEESIGESTDDTICQRFDISIGPSPPGEFPYEGFNDIGMVNIKYRFPPGENAESDDDKGENFGRDAVPAYPKYCYLGFTTNPFTELHKIPLIVYPGQTDIAGTQYPRTNIMRDKNVRGKYKKKNQGKKTDITGNEGDKDETEVVSHTVVGFDGLLGWYRSSRIGTSLKSVLEQAHGEQRDLGWFRRDNTDKKILEKYITSLCRKSLSFRDAHLRPVLLKVGAIRDGAVETASFYMTNHNPIPLLVSVDVGEVEGMSISLARVPSRGQGDGHNILDHFPKKRSPVSTTGIYHHLVRNGEYRGHPLEGLQKFLRTSDVAQQLLGLFRFRDAISMSPSAVGKQPLLNTLYKKYAFGEFHRDPLPIRFGKDGWSQCRRRRRGSRSSKQFMEPDYEYNVTRPDDGDDDEDFSMDDHAIKIEDLGKSPLMISDDIKVARKLKVCWDKRAEPMEYPSDGTYTIVPPGAVARFELKLHSPPRSMLRDDITRFLSTGLVLSTDHGEIIPIFVTYEALLGDLQVKAKSGFSFGNSGERLDDYSRDLRPVSDNKDRNNTVHVPAGLFQESRNLSETAGGEVAVTLSVTSSFSRDIRLVKMSSCNPWFEVSLHDSDGSPPLLQSYRGAGSQHESTIGSIQSAINCQPRRHPIANLALPSFYQCALNWLADRGQLQPRDCGAFPTLNRRLSAYDDYNLIHVAESVDIKRAMKASEKALLVSSFAFGSGPSERDATIGHNTSTSAARFSPQRHGSSQSRDGFISSIVLDVFAEAWDAWQVVSRYGLGKLTSTLTATIEYDSVEESSNKISKLQNLSISLRDTVVETLLAPPKLLNLDLNSQDSKILNAKAGDDENVPEVEFIPTLVTDYTAMYLPLRNPTSVPVRVRLAAVKRANFRARLKTLGGSNKTGLDAIKKRFSVDENVRDAFTEMSASPFIQSGALNATTQYYHAGVVAEQLWWDGTGGFFLADEDGDLIRSHHNIRIMAGAGAHVTLVNPSLHSNIALLVGCGVRCGIRDEKNPPHNDSSKLTSPIGAAAAAGFTLSGRMRSNLPQVNVRTEEEPTFVAGAATVGKYGGPAAFAIPYSALSEIVIPPYGEAEIGPIMFRPPGRYSVHGCKTALSNRIVSLDGNSDRVKACRCNEYKAMVYLENSLTGLERVSLKGKALWESVVFLDPPLSDDPQYHGDDYGDIEVRHGRQALVFSGSTEKSRSTLQPMLSGSVVKEVVVHNDGDTVVDFERAYLSDSTRLHETRSTSKSLSGDLCAHRQFRLRNCFDVKNDNDDKSVVNVRNGFTLGPGQNMSLYIEHFPDCARAHDFIALNLERRRRDEKQRGSPTSKNQKNVFRQRKVDLLVGYDMTEDEYRTCKPLRRWGYSMKQTQKDAQCRSSRACGLGGWFTGFTNRILRLSFAVLIFLLTSGALLVSYALLYKLFLFRRDSSEFFSAALAPRRKSIESSCNDKGRGNWSATFRCLARADPSSTDLQMLGREQIRHVVLGRYKSQGILPPQCFNSNGVFNRERGGAVSGTSPSKQISGKDGSAGGGDRARTISDAIYRQFSIHQDLNLRRSIPCGLSWRAAVSRGVPVPRLLESTSTKLRTQQLLIQRITQTKSVEDTSDEQSTDQLSTNDGSARSDVASDSQSVEGEDSQLQESFVSELSDEALDAADGRNEEVALATANNGEYGRHKLEDLQGQKGGAGNPQLGETADLVSENGRLQNHKRTNTKGETTAGSDGSIVASNDVASTRESSSREDAAPEIKAREAKKDRGATPQKKSAKATEQKRDRRGRQKARGASPAKAQGTESVGADKKSGAAQNQRAKTQDAARSQRTVGKNKNISDSGKQPPGKSNQQGDKKGSAVAATASDGKETKMQDAEEKNSKRRGNKGGKGRVSRRNSRDGTNDGVKSENNPKTATNKKGKKARAGKAESGKGRDQSQEPSPVPKPTESEPLLRPPPGLAPPPGFGGESANPTASPLGRSAIDTTLLTPAAFLSDSSVLGSPSSNVMATPSRPLSDATLGGLPSSLLSTPGDPASIAALETPLRSVSSLHAASNEAAAEALLASVANTPMTNPVDNAFQPDTTTAGFDVMNFLDNILNEGSADTQQMMGSPQPEQATNPSPFLSREATPVQPISLNPWASERQSRATAYGIAMDDGATGTEGLSSPAPPGIDVFPEVQAAVASPIPLINTAAILYAGELGREGDDENDDEDNEGSFYASLLGKTLDYGDDPSSRYSG